MVRKKTLSVALSALLLVNVPISASSTGWTAWASSGFQGATAHPSSIKTQKTTSLSGGGVRVRWGNLGTINPIHIEPPRFAVGCSGMDFSLGSISFLNFDELVEKLKMVAAAAPAFAFKMAIDTVCSQCATIMQDLEEIVNMINNMSLDACQMAENLGNGVGSVLGSAIGDPMAGNDTYETISSGLRDVRQTAQMITDGFNALDDLQIKSGFYGSFLNRISEQSNDTAVQNFIPHLRAMVGDFGYYVPADGDEATRAEVAPNLNGVEELYKAMLEPDGSNSYRTMTATDIKEGNMPIDIVYDTVYHTPLASQALYNDFFVELTDILVKMKTQKLTPADINFVQYLPKNGYKILNTVYVESYTNIISGDDSEYLLDYAKYAALQYLTSSLKNSIHGVSKTLTDYTSSLSISLVSEEGLVAMREMLKNLKMLMLEVDRMHAQYEKNLPDINLEKYNKALESRIQKSFK
jgi:conjugative transfer pilus assembly protein TraH